MALSRKALGLFFYLQGSGDLGETLELTDGRTVRRLGPGHAREYGSAFGAFILNSNVYGSREGQKIALAPLDARLQLPASDYSYVLQQWY